jgi:putative membrane protein
MSKKPVVIALDTSKVTEDIRTPDSAPPVPESLVQEGAMHVVAQLAVRKPSILARFFLWVVITLLGFVVSVAFWDFGAEMMARNLWLGRITLSLLALFTLGVVFFVVRELAAFARLRRMDGIRAEAEAIYSGGDLRDAQGFSKQLERLYHGRHDLRWAFAKTAEQSVNLLDSDAHMDLMENTVVLQLDRMAEKEIEGAAQKVATITALIPLALVDVVMALSANLRMIRRIAQIYGGRSSIFGSWRLLRVVAAHLVATGAVAIGDDLIGSIAGGGVLSKISRRFGEGVINGALTARVGVAAMEVCRPMPFRAVKKPSVACLMQRALAGFVGIGD